MSSINPANLSESSPVKPGGFASFCASIDTSGGHIVIGLTVIMAGMTCIKLALPTEGHDLVVFGLGILATSMRGQGAENHDRNAPQSARVTVSGEPIKQEPSTIETQNIEKVDVTAPKDRTSGNVLGPVSSGPKEQE